MALETPISRCKSEQDILRPTPTPTSEPHALIASAAHGVVHRSQTHTDGHANAVTQNDTVKSARSTASEAGRERDAGFDHGGEMHAQVEQTPVASVNNELSFVPKVMLEPRRVLHRSDRLPIPNDLNVFSAVTRQIRLPNQAAWAARAIKSTATTDALSPPTKGQRRQSTPSAHKRSDPNAEIERTAAEANIEIRPKKPTLADIEPSPADGTLSDGLVGAPLHLEKGNKSDPLKPPPVPRSARRFALRKQAWGKRKMQVFESERGENFGDGQRWRTPEPALTGPSLDDEPALSGTIYAHTEEACVEIIRSRPRQSKKIDASAAPPPIPKSPSPPDAEIDPPGKTARARPARRIFKALKGK